LSKGVWAALPGGSALSISRVLVTEQLIYFVGSTVKHHFLTTKQKVLFTTEFMLKTKSPSSLSLACILYIEATAVSISYVKYFFQRYFNAHTQ
jgi:hypothetical protein